MNLKDAEDVKNVALKLEDLKKLSDTDYAYLRGWINCALQKENNIKPLTLSGKGQLV